MLARCVAAMLALAPLAGCDGCGHSRDPRTLVDAGNAALGRCDSKAALVHFEAAQRALEERPNDALQRSAKLGAIEARIRLDAKAAAAEFLHYAAAHPSSVRAADCIDISGKLANANAIDEALDVVRHGKGAFAESTKLNAQEQRIIALAKHRAEAGDEAPRRPRPTFVCTFD